MEVSGPLFIQGGGGRASVWTRYTLQELPFVQGLSLAGGSVWLRRMWLRFGLDKKDAAGSLFDQGGNVRAIYLCSIIFRSEINSIDVKGVHFLTMKPILKLDLIYEKFIMSSLIVQCCLC